MLPPARAAQWIIASDVDGTSVDGNGRLPVSPEELRARLNAAAPDVHLLLASSRTAAELRVLQRVLGTIGPLIAEDGADLAWDSAAPFRPFQLINEAQLTDAVEYAQRAITQYRADVTTPKVRSLPAWRRWWRNVTRAPH